MKYFKLNICKHILYQGKPVFHATLTVNTKLHFVVYLPLKMVHVALILILYTLSVTWIFLNYVFSVKIFQNGISYKNCQLWLILHKILSSSMGVEIF